MMLFCNGAVIMASKRPVKQPATAAFNRLRTYCALAGFKVPAVTDSAISTDCISKRFDISESIFLGVCNKVALPSTVMCALGCSFKKVQAAARLISGPMPAGSPELMTRLTGATCGIIYVDNLHRCGISQLTNPILIGLLKLSFTNSGTRKFLLLINR